MSDRELSCGLVIFLLFLGFSLFSTGWCIGNNATTKSLKQSICQAIKPNTDDYINCNARDFSQIIKDLKK